MKVVALLPMKGNSERVPNKNLKTFNGRPLYHVIANTLLSSKLISEIYINTDSEKIKKDIETHFKSIKVLMRPDELVGDFVSMNKIIEHDLNLTDGDLYIQTHSTNPLLKVDTIDSAIERLVESEGDSYDSVFSVTKVQTRFYEQSGKPHNHNPEELLRTQDLEPLYEENSNFFIFTKESFQNRKARIGSKPLMFEMDKVEAIDIDEPQDFIIAEAIERTLA